MPIYEYTCSKCRKKIEVIQKMSDKPLKTHAGCGGKLTKEISASGFQFKGTGWYITDYAQKGKSDSSTGTSAKSDSTKADAPAADSTSKSESTKSDSTKADSSATSSAKESKG